MLRRLLPGLEPAQVGEDLAGPDEELSVLGLERGDLVGARHGLEARALLRPRLDLACHEVEAELREDLAHRRRERAPLGLVERQHRASLSPVQSGSYDRSHEARSGAPPTSDS